MRDTLLPSKASKRANSWLGKSFRLLFQLMERQKTWCGVWGGSTKVSIFSLCAWVRGTWEKGSPGCPGLGAEQCWEAWVLLMPVQDKSSICPRFAVLFSRQKHKPRVWMTHVQLSVFLIKVCSFYVLFPVFIFSQMMGPFIIRGDNFD